MKPRSLFPILALLMIFVGVACKKNNGSKEPYNLAKTEWQGEAKIYDKNFKPMKVSFKDNKQLELSYVDANDPSLKYTFVGTWQKSDDSDNVTLVYLQGLETITGTATLTENNTKMTDGILKSSGDPNQNAGTFSISRQ